MSYTPSTKNRTGASLLYQGYGGSGGSGGSSCSSGSNGSSGSSGRSGSNDSSSGSSSCSSSRNLKKTAISSSFYKYSKIMLYTRETAVSLDTSKEASKMLSIIFINTSIDCYTRKNVENLK